MTNNRADMYPNQVQVGINDTPLTVALVKGDYKTAEKLIMENFEDGYLDEGPFEKIPLALVLSGDHAISTTRHLRLAKLLVERGANANLRIPQAEWQGASPSPMEYLVDLYMRVKELCRYGEAELTGDEIDTSPLNAVGLHDEEQLTPLEMKEQLLELLDIFLECGGNPNVTTTQSNSTLYHYALLDADPDINFVMKLCEAGGDLNQTNVHGTTPLMDLVTYADCDSALEILSKIWEKRPDISSLDAQNCSNETTLWRAMLAGSPQLAIELLERGADPTPRATVACGKWHRGKKYLYSYARETVKSGLSAIFAPLLQNSSPYLHYATACQTTLPGYEFQTCDFNIDLFNKVMSSAVYPVIDSTYFCECFPEKILLELQSVLESETKFNMDAMVPQALKHDDVAVLMFGNVKAGLQQLCVRRIIHRVFFEKTPRAASELIGKLKKVPEVVKHLYEQEENCDEDSSVDFDKEYRKDFARKFEDIVDDWEVVQELTPSAIQCLVEEQLQLPFQFTPRFQIEAARLQFGSCLYTLESIDCLQGCDGDSDASTDNLLDDDIDEDEDDDDDESSWDGNLWREVLEGDLLGYDDEEDMDFSSSDVEEELKTKDEDSVSIKEDNNTPYESSNESGEAVPQNICREQYESFNDDTQCEDSSPVTDMDVGDRENSQQ
ncbi:Uncharacterized protein GBIM_12748 [Gryllus bimaculatus]|nr:Uncharacterized protein GBIM_12748 [Gryllus bimaculatus]